MQLPDQEGVKAMDLYAGLVGALKGSPINSFQRESFALSTLSRPIFGHCEACYVRNDLLMSANSFAVQSLLKKVRWVLETQTVSPAPIMGGKHFNAMAPF